MALRQSAIRNPQSAMRRRHGFSFVEVLFAVMILGIGFILIAGVFPVAISQTQSNGEETVGAAIGRNGVAYVSQMSVNGDVIYALNGKPAQNGQPAQAPQAGWPAGRPWPGAMLDDGRVHAITPRNDWNVDPTGPTWGGDSYLWHALKGNMVQPDDPRFAWAAFYKRGKIPVPAGSPAGTLPTPAGYAQLIVIACRNRFESLYDLRMDAAPTTVANPYPLPKLANGTLFSPAATTDLPDTVQFPTAAAPAIAPGTFVVIANDTTSPTPPIPDGANGWVVRVGNQIDATTWELLPGNDFKNIPPGDTTKPQFYKPSQADVYVIGRAFDPVTKTFTGAGQDVSVYTTFIQLR